MWRHYNFCLLPRILVTNRQLKKKIKKENKKGIDPEINRSFMWKNVKKNVSCAAQSWYAHVTLNRGSI